MPSKLLKFNRSDDTYLNLADKYVQEGNLPRAMRALRLSMSDNFSCDALLTMGENYYNHGMYAMAEVAFLQLYPYREYRQDALLGLYLVCLQTGDSVRANRYVTELVRIGGDLSSEDLEGVVQLSQERADEEIRSRYRVAYPEPDEHKLDRANALLGEGNRLGAIEVLSEIKEGSECFSDARCNSALAYLMERDVASTVKECMRALRADGENLRASSILITAFYERGQTALADNLIARVTEIEPKNEDDIISVAMAMCQIRRHDLARKYLMMVVDRKYDKHILEFLTVAQYNDGRHDEALKTLSDLSALYGEWSNACFYRELIKSGEKLELPYYVELSDEIKESFASAVFDNLEENNWKGATGDVVSDEMLGYAIRCSEDEKFVKRLSRTKAGRKYLHAFLMKPYVSEKNKVLAMTSLIKHGETPYVMGVHAPTRVSRTPATVANAKGLETAYGMASSFVALTQPSAIEELIKSAEKLTLTMNDFTAFRSTRELAYILLVGVRDSSYLSEYFALLMGVNPERAKRYMDTIVSNATQTE